jgi:hypothetical protein
MQVPQCKMDFKVKYELKIDCAVKGLFAAVLDEFERKGTIVTF